jgi:uncharacterized protein
MGHKPVIIAGFLDLAWHMNAFVIDIFEFCRLKEHRQGEIPVSGLLRLTEELADNSGLIHWSLQGGMDKWEHHQLILTVSARLQLICQRCLTAFAFAVEAKSTLILAKDEESADKIEELLADDALDVIVGAHAFNLLDLIEDEALLALPFVPKHKVCPEKEIIDTETGSSAKIYPFAKLKTLT